MKLHEMRAVRPGATRVKDEHGTIWIVTGVTRTHQARGGVCCILGLRCDVPGVKGRMVGDMTSRRLCAELEVLR